MQIGGRHVGYPWLLFTGAVLGVLLIAATLENVRMPWDDGLPEQACWGTIDREVITEAAPADAGPWEVTEQADEHGDPMCTVAGNGWEMTATVRKTPLETMNWSILGRTPLGPGLPGMVKPAGRYFDGWLHLPQCENTLISVTTPGPVDSDPESEDAAADTAAEMLLTVGNGKAAACGGEPFPVPASFDWSAAHPVAPDEKGRPCGIELPPSFGAREWPGFSQRGGLRGAPLARCTALLRNDEDSRHGEFSALVMHEASLLKAFTYADVLSTVQVKPGEPLRPSTDETRYDRSVVTRLTCSDGEENRYVHVISSGTDEEYATITRRVLSRIAEDMPCG